MCPSCSASVGIVVRISHESALICDESPLIAAPPPCHLRARRCSSRRDDVSSPRHQGASMDLTTILIGLAIDVVVILTLVFAVYRPRHTKSDLALSYVVLNLGVFGAVALLAGADAGLALGMGLFGILSIIRLRSTAISQTEVAYYFVALVLGLVNSLGATWLPFMVAINVLLLGVARRPRPGSGGHRLTPDREAPRGARRRARRPRGPVRGPDGAAAHPGRRRDRGGGRLRPRGHGGRRRGGDPPDARTRSGRARTSRHLPSWRPGPGPSGERARRIRGPLVRRRAGCRRRSPSWSPGLGCRPGSTPSSSSTRRCSPLSCGTSATRSRCSRSTGCGSSATRRRTSTPRSGAPTATTSRGDGSGSRHALATTSTQTCACSRSSSRGPAGRPRSCGPRTRPSCRTP